MLRLISSLTSSGNSHLSHGTKEKHRKNEYHYYRLLTD